MPHPWGNPGASICVKLVSDANVGMAQGTAGSVNAVHGADHRAVLLAQRMQWLICIDALHSQPIGQLLEISLASIVTIGGSRLRCLCRLNHKIPSGPRTIPTEDLHHLGINRHVTDGVLALWLKMQSRLNSYDPWFPEEGKTIPASRSLSAATQP